MMEESVGPELESVILELQIQLEQKSMISKPNNSHIVPRSTIMNKIEKIHNLVTRSIIHRETHLVLSLGSEEPSTISSSESKSPRDIYYQNVRLFKSQQSVNRTIDKICQLMNTPQWALNILSTSKGLVFGPVRIFLKNGETIDCSLQQGGTLIPQDLPSGASYESSAKFGLILEKDTAFQNVLSSGFPSPLNSCILITGKGYPDMNTRFFVRDLSAKLLIPIFAIVDCDPHGIDIFFNYKYGSMAKAFLNEELAAPHITWLGIHPTDMIGLEPTILQPLSPRDVRKIRCLSERSYVKDDENLSAQSLAQQGRKCEIENITSISNRFLIDVYIPAKISSKKFI